MSNTETDRRVGRPPGADAEKTRIEILDAALVAFAARGFEGASIREITGAVGVGHNLVRHYFGSKEDLWAAAMRHGIGPMADRLLGILEPSGDQSPEETLRYALGVLLFEASRNRHAVRMLISESMRGGPRFEAIYDEFMAPVAEAMAGFAAEVKGLAPVDLRVAGLYTFAAAFSPFAFGGLVDQFGLVKAASPEKLDRQARQLIDLIVRGLLRPDG